MTVTQVAVAIVERGDLVLVGQRPRGVPLAGYWEFPGGKVKAGETYQDAVRRECLEETGLSVELVGEFRPTTHAYEHATIAIRFFRCVPREGSDLSPNTLFLWRNKSSLSQLVFPPANDGVLRELTSERVSR